jgi:hypothetical protein
MKTIHEIKDLIGKSDHEIIHFFKNKWFVFKKVSKETDNNILEGVFSSEEESMNFILNSLPLGQYLTINLTTYLRGNP